MNEQIKKRILRTAILALIGLGLGGMIALYEIKNEAAAVVKPGGVAGAKIGGAFTLTDHNGNAVTEKLFEGKYKLIYFGFTFCPAICPTELQKITKTLKTLGPEGENILPVFITVDPERDTVEVMKNYVSLFHPRLIGLTGTPEQIEQAKKAYKIYAAKAQDPDNNDYTMDHSSFIYFIEPEGDLLGIYRTEDTADMMAADIQKYLSGP